MVGVAVVGTMESVVGFKLAGVNALECSPETAEQVVSSALLNEEIGLLIVPNDVVPLLSVKIRRVLEASSKPVVVFIPGKDGKTEKSSDVAALVKRAIGIDLSKK